LDEQPANRIREMNLRGMTIFYPKCDPMAQGKQIAISSKKSREWTVAGCDELKLLLSVYARLDLFVELRV
jgi:hypothetical protein